MTRKMVTLFLALALVLPVLMDSLGRFIDYGFYAVSDLLKAGGAS